MPHSRIALTRLTDTNRRMPLVRRKNRGRWTRPLGAPPARSQRRKAEIAGASAAHGLRSNARLKNTSSWYPAETDPPAHPCPAEGPRCPRGRRVQRRRLHLPRAALAWEPTGSFLKRSCARASVADGVRRPALVLKSFHAPRFECSFPSCLQVLLSLIPLNNLYVLPFSMIISF